MSTSGSCDSLRRLSRLAVGIPGTSRRIRLAFGRMADSTRTPRSGSGGRSPTWATVSARLACSTCSIRLVRPEMVPRFSAIAWSRTSSPRTWEACRRYVGRGGWTWYTGSAAWMWRLGVERILGLRPEAGGVRIEPCLPRSWRRVDVTIRRPGGGLVDHDRESRWRRDRRRRALGRWRGRGSKPSSRFLLTGANGASSSDSGRSDATRNGRETAPDAATA